MRGRLDDIVSGKRLCSSEAKALMLDVLGEAGNGSQLAALLALLRLRGVTADELEGFCQAVLELSTPVDLGGEEVVDVCGTGGDGKGSFNISTTVAFVLAGSGCRVAKHGNYAVSSTCGSSNVLEELGVPLLASRDALLRSLERAGVCFLHAPLFHPALKRAAPVRRELGFRTVFNMLGPLVSPASPTFQMAGVYDREALRLYGHVLRSRGISFVAFVSSDGHDEVTLTAPLSVVSRDGEAELVPGDFGLPQAQPSALAAGANTAESAAIVRRILEGRGTKAQEDVVCAGAGLALRHLRGKLPLQDYVEAARESIASGRALRALELSTEGR